MPGPPRPKRFVAAQNFTHRRQSYSAGDPVTDRRTIDRLLRYGDRYLVSRRTAPAEPPADVDSAPTPNTAESHKES